MGAVADGFCAAFQAIQEGIEPDPDMWVDEWADAHMVLPTGKSAEPGQYRISRTPYARAVLRALSPGHPCRRVVVMGPSQLMKTQIALAFIGASIHQAPANILTLLPTTNLAKRVSSRITDTVRIVPVLRDRVAEPRSRDARNTMDTKEFSGGTIYITTAGSAANLAEVPARYIVGDEVDRWEGDVGGEGDPVELAEARASTFAYNAKFYYPSSPTVEGQSRIHTLYLQGTRNRYHVQCPHCAEHQTLEWEHLRWDDDDLPTRAWYVCPHCGAEIEEKSKATMLPDAADGGTAEWRPDQVGDGETESFWINALYAPLGFVSWLSLARQYVKAKARYDKGDPQPLQVFYNTRLARVWDAAVERTKAEEIKSRAEHFPLGIVPRGGLVLTAAVDVQPSRLEVEIKAWGVGLENWNIAYRVLWGDPTQQDVWTRLDELMNTPILNWRGVPMRVLGAAIDSGGANTQDVYNYTRNRRHRHVLAIKGSSKPNRPVIAARPSKVDVTWQGETEKEGALLWMVGTDVAKDWIFGRIKLTGGPGAAHFSKELPDDYFEQLTAERKVIRYVKGHARSEWVKSAGARNEATDLFVYNLAMAYYFGLHAYSDAEWERLRLKVDPVQGDMFRRDAPEAAPPAGASSAADHDQPEPPAPADPVPAIHPPRPQPAAVTRKSSGRRVVRFAGFG
ncbi:MAG: phage terminase large subunit family protein [Rhodocyclaceae bacterium]|nr:phage terminase large subunit family protein [Rhodocyclaceae bacterium]